MNPYHRANQKRWDATARNWKAMHDRRGTWKLCAQNPELVFVPREMSHLQQISGKKAAVLGSGDNLAVFALAGMGARVTSVDLSQEQLEVARERARELALDIEFLQADVTDLSALEDTGFDLVYTGGHVAVWVADLLQYYREAGRILKKGGLFIVNEYHPFRRVWKNGVDRLEVEYDYYDRGPFVFKYDDDVLHRRTGEFTQYEFHWTVSDLITAMLGAGCSIIDAAEFGEHVGDWEGAPLEGLPEYFMLVGRKGSDSLNKVSGS